MSSTKIKNIYYEGRIKVPYNWYVGEVGSRFLVNLRDNKEIWGIRCPSCKKVYVPPVKTCWECFIPNEEWVKLSDTGTIMSFTVVHYRTQAMPKRDPLIYGLIKIDEADGSFLHILGDIDPRDLAVGLKVKAVFADARSGTILDIKYFAPVHK
jgi:uncharacterized OB-fold protein